MSRPRVVIPTRTTFTRMGKHLFVNAVREVLTSIGYDVELVPDCDVELRDLGFDDILFLVDIVAARNTLGSGRRRRRRFTVLYFNMEPVGGDLNKFPMKYRKRFSRYQNQVCALCPDIILDYNLHTSRFWRRKKIVAYHCPMGYHESYELPPGPNFKAAIHSLGEETWAPKPPGMRRGKQHELKMRRGFICESLRAAGLPCKSYVFRKDFPSVEKLNRSPGVHLNINQVDPPFTFGPLRVISFCLSNSRFVLSEPCCWYPKGLVAGEHWDIAGPGAFVERAAYWWSRPRDREQIGRAGYEFIKRNHRLDQQLPAAFANAGLFYG